MPKRVDKSTMLLALRGLIDLVLAAALGVAVGILSSNLIIGLLVGVVAGVFLVARTALTQRDGKMNAKFRANSQGERNNYLSDTNVGLRSSRVWKQVGHARWLDLFKDSDMGFGLTLQLFAKSGARQLGFNELIGSSGLWESGTDSNRNTYSIELRIASSVVTGLQGRTRLVSGR